MLHRFLTRPTPCSPNIDKKNLILSMLEGNFLLGVELMKVVVNWHLFTFERLIDINFKIEIFQFLLGFFENFFGGRVRKLNIIGIRESISQLRIMPLIIKKVMIATNGDWIDRLMIRNDFEDLFHSLIKDIWKQIILWAY